MTHVCPMSGNGSYVPPPGTYVMPPGGCDPYAHMPAIKGGHVATWTSQPSTVQCAVPTMQNVTLPISQVPTKAAAYAVPLAQYSVSALQGRYMPSYAQNETPATAVVQ